MKHPVTLGVVCLARHTFDTRAAAALYGEVLKELGKLEQVSLEPIRELIIEPEEARAAAARLRERAIDGLICISGTFHLGHLVLKLHQELERPILLWHLSEPPYDGGKIRLNSLCGLNLNASNLYKAGVRTYWVDLGPRFDEDWVDALRALKALRRARLGLAGFRAHGFFNLDVYGPAAYSALGVLIDHFELEEIYRFEAEPAEIRRRGEQLASLFDVSGISGEQLERTAALAARLDAFLHRHSLDALALRCWPEFAERAGLSPCAAMSLLQAEGRILACEGDVDGALSMLAQTAVGAAAPFLFDFSQADFEADEALLWHCGAAPCNLWDGRCARSLDTYFAGGRGVTADFVLQEGELSILRLDSCAGEYRVFLARARAVPMEKQLKGTYLKAVFEQPVRALFQTIAGHGLAHHASMAYGDFLRPFEAMAGIKGWEIIR